jgi:AcrR family transcriptional regulator
MSKPPASPKAIETVRESILKEALAIINQYGYDDLSMRKLASRLGFTAKTIYNYYSNKDEIYLMALIRGFEALTGEFQTAYASSKNPLKRLEAVVRAYVRWGIENKHYYNIMFIMNAPKYSDYTGTKMEVIADRQNKVGLQLPRIGTTILKEVAAYNGSIRPDEIQFRLLYIWSTLHGMVSLYISRVTLEVADIQEVMDRIVKEVVRPFKTKNIPGRST